MEAVKFSLFVIRVNLSTGALKVKLQNQPTGTPSEAQMVLNLEKARVSSCSLNLLLTENLHIVTMLRHLPKLSSLEMFPYL